MGISIENLSFHYTGTPVLDQVNLEVKDGDYAILTGENGSGKSTFIKILKKYSNISEKEEIEIKTLKRGEALLFVGDNHVLAEIKSFPYEDEIINKGEEKIKNE